MVASLRRRFDHITRILAGLITALSLSGGLAAESAIVGALSFPGDPFDQYWRTFERTLSDETSEIELKLFIRGELGPEEVLMSGLRRGRIHLSSFTASGLTAVIPEFTVTLAPYLFDSYEEVDYVYDHHLMELVETLCSNAGLQFLSFNDEGWFHLYGKRPLVAPDDALNYRMRALQAPSSRAFLAEIGADVISLPFPDVTPSLQTGLISGGETGTMIYAVAELYNEAPHLTLTRHAYSAGVTVANKRWFDRLSPESQKALRRAVPKPTYIRRLLRDWVQNDFQRIERAGGFLHELSDQQRGNWRAATIETHDRLIASAGGESRRLYDLIIEAKRIYRDRHADSPIGRRQ